KSLSHEETEEGWRHCLSLAESCRKTDSSSSPSVSSPEAVAHDSVPSTNVSRISGDIVPSILLTNASRASGDNVILEEEEGQANEGSGSPPVPPVIPPPPPPPVYDPDRLPQDPGERKPIESYPVNDQDAIRRAYILKGPIQQCAQEYEKRHIGMNNLVDLSMKMVETNRHTVYDLVYLLLKLVLILPVATASVERSFSAMNFIKNRLRNRMRDTLLDDCLVTFIERDIFLNVLEDDIIDTFMSIRRRRPDRAAVS
ncbi:hypothetical protein EJB05_13289, partial [Eragrostis curvula]